MQNLPHQLIKAFHATFEEILEADLWLHIIDVSDDYRDHKQQVVTDTIAEMTETFPRMILILNKCDLLPKEEDKEEIKRLGMP